VFRELVHAESLLKRAGDNVPSDSSEALIKGQKDGWKILKTVMKDKIREVV
jgi:hypothetical protein